VQDTKPVRELAVDAYDVLVVAGGQGPMFTFKDATDLQQKFVAFYESGKVTSALCHGTAVLALRHLV
jgi:putative intracellular protease/amidase